MGRKSRGGSSPAPRRSAAMVGKRSSKSSSPVASRQHVLGVLLEHLAGDGAAPRRLAAAARPRTACRRGRGSARRDRAAPRTAAAGACGAEQRGRVELHELDVGARHTGAQRHGQPVARRLDRIGGGGEQLAGAAGGERGRDGRGPRGRGRRDPGRDADAAATGRRADRARTTAPRRPTAVARTSSTSARSISAPVAAPPAWTMRGSEWPPSRASCSWPSRSRSNVAPMAISSLTRLGPSSTRARTASTSHRPAPAAEGVGQVEVGRVGVAAQHRCHARPAPSGWPPATARTW